MPLDADLRPGADLLPACVAGLSAAERLLDAARREVWWHGETVGFTAREYALLEALVLSKGRWFTRQELLSKVWGPDFGGAARVVDVYVSYLRRKLSPEALLSSRGLGYQVP